MKLKQGMHAGKRISPKRLGNVLANYRGFDSEDTVRNLLGILKKHWVILSYTKTQRYSIPDSNGVDFWVEFLSKDMKIKSFPLQVKSSWGGLAEHRKKFRHACVIVDRNTEKRLCKIIKENRPKGCRHHAGIKAFELVNISSD